MLSCTQCNKKFKYKSEKVRHEQSHSREFECSFCNKKFNFQSALNRHQKQHIRTGNVACDKCGHTFRDEVLLKRHIKYAHDGTHKCGYCASTFHSLTALQTHNRIHQPESERKFCCKFEGCKKSFNFSHHLKNHELTHTNTKKYFCKHCGKGFIQGHHLKIHMKTHLAKWFYCEEDGCSKKFLSSLARDKHFKTHKTSSECPSTFSFTLSDINDEENKLLTIEVETDAVPLTSNLFIGGHNPQIEREEPFIGTGGKNCVVVNNNACKPVLDMSRSTNLEKSCLSAKINSTSSDDLLNAIVNTNGKEGLVITTNNRKNIECHNLFLNTQKEICEGCECHKNSAHINLNNNILISPEVPENPSVSLRDNGTIMLEETIDSSIQMIRRAQVDFTDLHIPFNSCKAVLGNCIVSGNGTMGEECLCAKMMLDRNVNSEEIDELTLVPYTK